MYACMYVHTYCVLDRVESSHVTPWCHESATFDVLNWKASLDTVS